MRVNAASAANPALLRQLDRVGAPKPKPAAEQTVASQRSDADAVETRQRPGNAVGIQKIVESGRDIPAAPNSRVGVAIAQARAAEVGSLEQPAPTDGAAGAQDASRYGSADLAYLNEAFGTKAGDAGFRAEYDFNADGLIDGADLGLLLGRFGEAKPVDPEPETQAAQGGQPYTVADAEALRAFWGAREGEDGYVQRLDLNADGLLDGADLGLILGAIGEPARDPGLEDQPDAPADVSPTDVAASSATDSPAVAEAVSLAEETIAGAESGFTLETRILDASDLLRVLDGLREESVRSLETARPDRAGDLDALREGLLASLLTPARTDALSNLRALIERLGGAVA